MNTILLNIIKKQILAEPRQFNMGNYFSGILPDGTEPANCGTAACIAGWAMAKASASNPKDARKLDVDRNNHAAMLLGITEQQAGRLFYEDEWPKQFQSTSRSGLKLRARRAAARINHFIKTKGRE